MNIFSDMDFIVVNTPVLKHQLLIKNDKLIISIYVN